MSVDRENYGKRGQKMNLLIKGMKMPEYNPKDALYTQFPANIRVFPDGKAVLNILIQQDNGIYLKDPTDYPLNNFSLPSGRLTTDTPQTNMEHMLNYAYAKDGRVILRFGAETPNMDLCEYLAKVAGNQCGVQLTPNDFMEGACLECDNGCPLGILYVVATQAAELRARLKDIEDSEEKNK